MCQPSWSATLGTPAPTSNRVTAILGIGGGNSYWVMDTEFELAVYLSCGALHSTTIQMGKRPSHVLTARGASPDWALCNLSPGGLPRPELSVIGPIESRFGCAPFIMFGAEQRGDLSPQPAIAVVLVH